MLIGAAYKSLIAKRSPYEDDIMNMIMIMIMNMINAW